MSLPRERDLFHLISFYFYHIIRLISNVMVFCEPDSDSDSILIFFLLQFIESTHYNSEFYIRDQFISQKPYIS